MIGCCGCTKAGCYQDQDVVEYFTGNKGQAQGYDDQIGGNRIQRNSDPDYNMAQPAPPQRGIVEERKNPGQTQLIDLK